MSRTVPTADEMRALVQRRTLRVLTLGQIVGGAALGSAITVGAFVIQGVLGSDTPWSGLAAATVTMGTAFMSQLLARRMRWRGRRPGLQLGYSLAIGGALVAAVGAEMENLVVFLPGLFCYGAGQSANLLARYAATDLAPPDQRGQAMSRIVFASTFGAVFGPLLIGPAQWAGETWFGLARYTGPWLASALFFTAATINTAVRLRPDPLVLAGGLGERHQAAADKISFVDTLTTISANRNARLALGAMVASHLVMVAVMSMTPVHLKLHGHEGVSQYVVSTHIAGMYAFSPFVGRFCDRSGRLPAILIGSLTLMAATVMAALSGDVEQLLFPSLWLLGLGWNFGLIGGSSLLIDSVPAESKVAVQGSADLLMSFCGGTAGFAAGFIRKAVGFHMLANFATIAAGLLVVAAYSSRRRSELVGGATAPS